MSGIDERQGRKPSEFLLPTPAFALAEASPSGDERMCGISRVGGIRNVHRPGIITNVKRADCAYLGDGKCDHKVLRRCDHVGRRQLRRSKNCLSEHGYAVLIGLEGAARWASIPRKDIDGDHVWTAVRQTTEGAIMIWDRRILALLGLARFRICSGGQRSSTPDDAE